MITCGTRLNEPVSPVVDEDSDPPKVTESEQGSVTFVPFVKWKTLESSFTTVMLITVCRPVQ